MHVRHRLVSFVALAAACTPGPAPVAADAAPKVTEPVAVEPSGGSPVAASPLATAPPPDAPTPNAPASDAVAPDPEAPDVAAPAGAEPDAVGVPALRVVALREGPVTLFGQRDAPVVALDGEPLRWIDGAFVRNPQQGAGLAAPGYVGEASLTLALADLEEPLGTWTSTVEEFERSASVYGVYRRTGAGWHPLDLRKGVLVAYYPAFVEREGALLALEDWAADAAQAIWADEEDSPAAERYSQQYERAQRRAKQRWIRLAGAEGPATPQIPADVQLNGSVTATDDGTLFALASERSVDGDVGKGVLLMWQPGERAASRVVVPELGPPSRLALQTSGAWASIAGTADAEDGEASYLAVGQGDRWEHVVVDLPSSASQAAKHINGVARTPQGVLWIALGNRWDDTVERQSVWRKPTDGTWQPVPLPEVLGNATGPADDWIRDPIEEVVGWTTVQREQSKADSGRATGLAWIAGAVWITAETEGAFEGAMDTPPRAMVVTNHPGTAPVSVLPPTWQVLLERRNHLRRNGQPGEASCQHFSLVLGPGSLGETPGAAAAVAAIAPENGTARVGSVYTASLDGVDVLVASASADSAKHAASLRKAASVALRAAGVADAQATADCRIPMLVRMVHQP